MYVHSVKADFNTTSFEVEFKADEGTDDIIPSIDVRVGIVDDNINERFEQLFLIPMEVASAINPETIDTTERNVTIGIIGDNDGEWKDCLSCILQNFLLTEKPMVKNDGVSIVALHDMY